ncbi:carboxyl transferase domain-containing protein [Neobacillus niacini]|uniref:acyl-CoA carboxylase subunit beta n=1 Tax=Neobacillus niacini TaxID=86668 RepID=UPI002FFF7956
MTYEKHIREFEARTTKAKQMGGEEKLRKRRESGILNVRERVDYLVDSGSWEESGLLTVTVDPPELREKTPADGKVAGFATINNREVAVVANDFTVKGSSSTPLNEKKFSHMKQYATKRGMPIIFLGESTGVRMPDVLGSANMSQVGGPTRFLRKRETPWVSAVMGYAFGSSAWHACCADFNVMRKGSIMAVSSPQLVSLATKAKVEPEELGGWRIHSEVTGFADVVVDTDQEALDAIKQFLSYLPSHSNEAPSRMPVPPGSGEEMEHILDLLPAIRSKVYDVRKIINVIVDKETNFELKARYGKSVVTSLARIDGRSVGIIASNPLFKGGSIDADACDKIISFVVLCDSFNIPLVFLIDQPGFLIGLEAEKNKITGKVINWMNALSLCTVPKIAIILRKSYGQAHINMGGGGMVDELAAWFTADVSFMDPVSGVAIVHGVNREDNPEQFEKLMKEFALDTTAYDMAAVYGVQKVLDPRETRNYLIRMLKAHEMKASNGVGERNLRTWPTSY